MGRVAEAHGVTIPQVGIAWAIAKGTLPLIGATKVSHVEEALAASAISLTSQEVEMIESAASATGAETRGSWENPMV